MSQLDPYFLGYRRTELQRLQRRAQILADETERLFDQIEVFAGARVVEIGCGPRGSLDLLAERVGPGGTVTGIERDEETVRLAREFVADRKLGNVVVVQGDARATGLPRGAFDLATARLVLVNVPQPEQIVAEMAALVRPGGKVLLCEADWVGHLCDPPLAAWNRIIDLLLAYSNKNGIDHFVGRRVPRMLREAGLIEIQVDPIIHNFPVGHVNRMLIPNMAENLRDRLLAEKIIGADELNALVSEVKHHLNDPHTLVVGGLYFQAWGSRP